jgi:hypothetical protein
MADEKETAVKTPAAKAPAAKLQKAGHDSGDDEADAGANGADDGAYADDVV